MGKKRRKCMLKPGNRSLSVFFFYLYMCAFLLHSSFHFCYAGDTMRQGNTITDDYFYTSKVTLVSERKEFEFGFFSPPGVARRYVGIWYFNLTPQTVVWVANRTNPLPSAGIFSINEDGNLEVSDQNGKRYWSTSLAPSSPASNRTLKLMDSGNLVLRDENDQSATSLWQSFENPSDTFLPGMKMDENLTLISWSSEDDPGLGDFTFKQDSERKDQYIIMKKAIPYWKSRARGEYFSSDRMPISISYLLSNFSEKIPGVYNYQKLVMGSTGNVLYQQWLNYSKEWSPIWSEPRDKCSVLNACGDFGSCNSNYEALTCKCLPGFEPCFTEKWSSGNFSGGCSRATGLCRNDDEFLKLERMKVGERGMSRSIVKNGAECRKKCLDNCHCRGYAFETARESSKRRDENSTATASCWTWLDYLNDLQEECIDGGRNFFLRIPLSVLGIVSSLIMFGVCRILSSGRATSIISEPKPRTCHPCGTTLVPYPLSTGPDCGDPMYFSFKCNNSILTFKALSDEYPVVGNINSSRKAFSIQGENSLGCNDFENSEAHNLQLNETLFNVTKIVCYQAINASKVEIQWKSPQEPICESDANCRDWPNSTCQRTKDGSRRCLCRTSFAWDGLSLSCIRLLDKEGSSGKGIPSFLVAVATAAGVLVLACAVIFFIICRRKMAKKEDKRSGQRNRALLKLDTQRHIKTLIDSGTFEEDESNIDVPFFSLESIIAATDGFSDANKLGQGGYGPVYKGNFPGGQEIAIKRLSSVSGQGLQEFKNEVVLIAKLQHRNLVRLRGYYLSRDEKILLYEYMPNRSLDSFIFDPTRSTLLDWETRFNIILGIARGLLYLHQDSRLRIIHRDMKTSNILLDQEMNPKISDFGLARMVGGKQRPTQADGYMSPEYALEGLFSVKSDVFSFGVVLLEIISGKRTTRFFQGGQALSLLAYAWRLWTENKKLDLLDQTLQGSCKKEQFIKCMNVGLLCVQEDPSDRPNMSNVITMLDGEATTLPSPKQPAFIIKRGSGTASSSSSKPDIHAEITLSLEEGR